MDKENYYDLLKDILLELYFEDSRIPNLDYEGKSKRVTKIDEEELLNIMNPGWIKYLGNSVDYDKLKQKFEEQYQSWKKLLNNFENVKNRTEMISFLKSYFQKSYLVGYELNEVTKKDIKSLIDHKKPKISKEFKGSIYIFDNFLIFTIDNLHITLHITIDSFRQESFLLTAIFAFWIEEPEDPFSLDMKIIHRNYRTSILAREIMDKLEVNRYEQIDLFDFEKYDVRNNQNTEFLNDWVKWYPHKFITFKKRILNANPSTLIDEIIEDLYKIKPSNELIRSIVQNPSDWFQNLTQELRVFYQKGKELFMKTSRILDTDIEKREYKTTKEEPEKRKEKLQVQDFIFLFKKAMDVDLNKGISSEEAGFRTFFQLFKDFLDKKERDKKYEFFEPVSRGTFYNLVNLYKDELEAILEKNIDKGQGGGDAYRIIRTEAKKEYEPEISIEEHISEATKQLREEIHEGLIYYNNLAYNKTINLYRGILKNKKDELFKSKEDYLGVLYYLGKSYLKLEDFKNAKEIFEKIYATDQNRKDAGFRLLECFYNLKEYEQSKKLAIELHEFLISFLDPYKSLYKKEIMYKDELRFFNVKREELHPNLFYQDLFNKYLIMLNRDIQFYDFLSLRPKFNGTWEDYENQLEDYEEVKYFLNLNIRTYRKLIMLRLSIQAYILEIYRKRIFYLFIIEKKEKQAYLEIKEVIEYLKEKISNKNLKQSRINDFLQYLFHFSKVYYGKEDNIVSEYLSTKFLEIDDKLVGYKYSFPLNTRFISWYLYLATNDMKSGNYKWNEREIGKEVKKPDLIIENHIIELLQIVNLDLNKLLNDANEKLENLEFRDEASWNYIFNQWKYQLYLGVHRGEDYFKEKIQEYKEYCNEHKLEFYIKIIEYINLKFEKTLTFIKNVNQKGRHLAINEILKNFHSIYQVEQEKIEVDFAEKSERFDFKFLLIQIQNKIFSLRNRDHGELHILIKLFNSKITEEIYKELIENIKPPNIIKLELNQNTILLKFYKVIIPSNIAIDFGQYLDYFFFDFFDAFEISTDKIVFRYIEEFEDRLKDFFENQFVKEFENPYFKFEIEHNKEHLYYLITIKKKEVK